MIGGKEGKIIFKGVMIWIFKNYLNMFLEVHLMLILCTQKRKYVGK